MNLVDPAWFRRNLERDTFWTQVNHFAMHHLSNVKNCPSGFEASFDLKKGELALDRV
jgi:hypothetical protein